MVMIGTHLADAMMFLFSTSILSVFDIEKAIDANGMEITPEFAFTSGALTYVLLVLTSSSFILICWFFLLHHFQQTKGFPMCDQAKVSQG